MASKGTKQLRFGKIQKIIDELKIRKEERDKTRPIGSYFADGYNEGVMDTLQEIIEELEELGK